jgi:hypothetical protein
MMQTSIHCQRTFSFRLVLRGGAVCFPLLFCSCERAPSFSVLGSFFPDWMLCIVVSILLTVVARMLLLRFQFEQELRPLVLVYPSMAAFFAFTLWLIFFS